MKRRLTSLAACVIVIDLLAFGTAWQVGPALALTAVLAVPDVEPVLARFYAEPVREEVGAGTPGGTSRAVLYRSPRPRSALVLLADDADPDTPALRRLAATLARRDIAVFLPHRPGAASGAAGPSGAPGGAAPAALGPRPDPAPATRTEHPARETMDRAVLDAFDDVARTWGVPVRVQRASALRPTGPLTSPVDRAAEAMRLWRLAGALLAAR